MLRDVGTGETADADPTVRGEGRVRSWSLRPWLREPLLHFLLIGLTLLAVDHLVSPRAADRYAANRIELTRDDLSQMTVAWLAQGRPAPTAEQMRSLVEARVREEILYREALSLGLDRNDTIVKRRLAQKMEFLAEDVAALPEPSTAELRAWFAHNAARFALAPRASFRHLYFSPDLRGQRARDGAARVLQQLAGKPGDWPAATTLADPFMFQSHYADRSFEQMAKDFGPGFAQAVVQLPPRAWQGPIESGYGWHLVWVDSVTPGRVPAYEEVEADVKSEWIAVARSEAKRKAFESVRARYEVVLPR
jgi:peptidyl-prolyl cis-trans isomerase C